MSETVSYDFDVIVIGAGPGGYETAIKSAQMGYRTACVETGTFGGVCLNEGCIPTKTLVKTANLYASFKESGNFGIEGADTGSIRVNMEKLQARKQQVVSTLTGGVEFLLNSNKVKILKGLGSFVDAHTIAVNGKHHTSEYFIIATGSDVFMPPFIPVEGATNVLTSREMLNLDYVPETIVIIGGGVIGIEFAHVFSQLGSKVTVLELMDNILPMVDEEVSKLVKKRLKKNGVDVVNQAKVKFVKDHTVYYALKEKEKSVEADVILMAVGRTPRTEGLNAEDIGIEFERKAIKTDAQLRTNIPNIYAIGDVNGKVMLAHTASHEGFTALANISGNAEEMDYDRIPSCIYLEPEVACIGLTEKQAAERGFAVQIGRFPMMANGKSLVEGDTSGLAKVIVNKADGSILGVHLYGSHVTDMIGEISVAMHLGAKAEDIAKSIHPHPTVSEVLPESFMAALYGRAINC